MVCSVCEVNLVGPLVRDILLLPPKKLVAFAAVGAAAGIAFNLALSCGVRYVHKVATKGEDIVLREMESHPRLFVSAFFRAGVLYGAATAFEWTYANVPVVSRCVAGAVLLLRLCVGLPAVAPYSELIGGSPLTNALAGFFEVERAYCFNLPIPNIGMFGVSAVPLTAEQCLEVFGPAEDDRPGRFFTPTRLVRLGLQLSSGYCAIRLVRHLVLSKVLGLPSFVHEPSTLHSTVAIPIALLCSMAVVRDAEYVSVLGWHVGLVGVFSTMAVPMMVLSEFMTNNFRRSYAPPEEEMPMLAEELIDDIFKDFPVRYLAPNELARLGESYGNMMIVSALEGSTVLFAAALAVFSGLVFVNSTSNDEPLSCYERSLERLNADIGDDVMERQASVASVGDGGSFETCPICLRAERPTSQDMLRVRACGHEFHTECLAQWILQSQECPLCKGSIERELPDGVREKLEAIRSMPGEELNELLFSIGLHGSVVVAEALECDVRALLRFTPKEIAEIWTSPQFFNIKPKGILLLGKMNEIWSAHQPLPLAAVGAIEDLACMLVAPFITETLLPTSLMFPSAATGFSPPTNVLQAIGQQIVVAAHLFPY